MTQVIDETQLDYCDVLIKPKRSTLNSRSEPYIYRDYKFRWTGRVIHGNGLMVSNMATTGTFAMAEVMANNLMFTCLHKHYSFDELKSFLKEHESRIVFENTEDESKCYDFLDYVFVSTGIKDGDYEKICKVLDLGLCKNLCIDIANGYITKLLDFVKKIRQKYPDLVILVGNVVTGDMVQDLILAGADIIKCGIGSGANCVSRKQAGIGRPQLSTNLECAEAAHAVDGMICADGGINCWGDVCKAFGSGADFVMVGSMVAGTDEADGDIITKFYSENELENGEWIDSEGYFHGTESGDDMTDFHGFYTKPTPKIIKKQYKLAYGMSSKYAQDKHWGGMACYRASEGIVTLKPYVGSCQSIIDEYTGSLRSCMTYVNAKSLKNLPKVCTFYKVNRILNNDGKGIQI